MCFCACNNQERWRFGFDFRIRRTYNGHLFFRSDKIRLFVFFFWHFLLKGTRPRTYKRIFHYYGLIHSICFLINMMYSICRWCLPIFILLTNFSILSDHRAGDRSCAWSFCSLVQTVPEALYSTMALRTLWRALSNISSDANGSCSPPLRL